MSTDDPQRLPPTVFLSYASEDRPAAQSLRDALPAYGLEVWYDESALTGGDAWDQKIRRQIRECDFFMPVISAQTEVRPEGYFRREWRLAVERTLDMADDHPFLLPVVIDDTPEAGARVPEKFLSVQWTRLPGGKPTAALEALCRRLVSGETTALQPARKAPAQPGRTAAAAPTSEYPDFPREEPEQKFRFWFQVLGWTLQCAWIFFKRLPRWVRILIYAWLAIVLVSRACAPSSDRHAQRISRADAQRIKAIADNYQGSSNKADVEKLATQIAREFSAAGGGNPGARNSLLAIPFSAPSGDPAARKLADATFAQTYGRVAVSRHGRVGLTVEPLPAQDPSTAAERGREHHASYVVYGAVDNQAAPPSLVVKIVGVVDGSMLWSASYPVAGADPARIAADVDAKIQSLEEDD